MKKRIRIRKIGTKLILTYCIIVVLIFSMVYFLSLGMLKQQAKRELIRTDQEALRQISNSIVLMTDLMVEKVINVYSDNYVQKFFSELSGLSSAEFTKLKAEDYGMVKELKEVRKVLMENAMLYTQVNGGVTLMTEKGAIYTSWLLENSLDYSSNLTSEKGNWDQYFEGNLNNYKWEIVNERDAMSFQKNKNKNMLMCIYNYQFSFPKQRKGYICVSIDAEELKRCYKTYMDSDVKNDIFLLDQTQGRLVSLYEREHAQISEKELDFLKKNINKSKTEISTFEDEAYIYNCNKISERGWILVNKIPLDYIGKNDRYSIQLFLVIFLLGGLGACLLVVAFTFRFSYRIRYLKTLMQNAASTDYSVRYHVQYFDELDEIGESFNLMEDEIKKYTFRLLEEEKEKKINEINYLHAQINTHFLYNIFNSIKMLAVLQRNEDISRVITSLVKLLRGTLDVSDEMLTIEEELQNVKHYFQIENIIHLEELELKIDCADDLKNKLVPKLLLQPIVENSFIHGFSHSSVGIKRIWIQIKRKNDTDICIFIKDNGCGISKQQLLNIKNYKQGYTRSIGIKNIEERIHILFGEEYGIEIKSVLKKGTEIVLTIPLIEPKI